MLRIFFRFHRKLLASLFEPPGENFDYLQWIARLTCHVPDKGFKALRHCGFTPHVGTWKGPAARTCRQRLDGR
jgi:hypothetical protein